jgi:hypothetical protein
MNAWRSIAAWLWRDLLNEAHYRGGVFSDSLRGKSVAS